MMEDCRGRNETEQTQTSVVFDERRSKKVQVFSVGLQKWLKNAFTIANSRSAPGRLSSA
jgi:hypothetical protein